MLSFVTWDALAAAVTRPRAWLLGLGVVLLGIASIVLIGANASAGQAPKSVPVDSGSARADALGRQFPGGDRPPLLLVVTRRDGAVLTPGDLSDVQAARDRMQAGLSSSAGHSVPPVLSADNHAAIAVVQVNSDLSGLPLNKAVIALRAAAGDGLPQGLQAYLTGGPAFGADIASAFTDANVTLLAVTGLVVMVLLIVTYRSPVLWLAPLLVIGFADRLAAAVGTQLAYLTGLSFDGATSGITSVLVFGAGTNYALLLISRYRRELRRRAGQDLHHRRALRVAVRAVGPAIVASNATVVLSLLTLLFASTPSTRSLGALAACGLVVAAISVLLVLPPLLALCGPRLFWPFIPKPDGAQDNSSRDSEVQVVDSGAWHRVAEWVARRPTVVATVAIVVLAVLATGLLGIRIGLSQTEQFRVKADSVSGYQIVAAHFPAGLSNPTTVIAATGQASQVHQAIRSTPGVVSVTESGQSTPGMGRGLTKWAVVIDAPPASGNAFKTVAALRSSVTSVSPSAVVGRSDAQALDVRDAAAHDRLLLIPAILGVILVVLHVLLRSALAPPILLSATILGALAALGIGGWASIRVFGFPALDNSTPLLAFLFLAALGVDYTIFLVLRAREEAAQRGARDGMVCAVSATGGVITSAGIVLAAVFCVLGVLPLIVLTQLGIIVGLGILLDTFVVRTTVIPALFVSLGDRIWWPAHLREAKPRERSAA